MLIREFHEADLAQLRAIHAAQGFDYPLPDLSNPLFVTKLVLTQKPSVVGARHAAPARIDKHAVTGRQPGEESGSVVPRDTDYSEQCMSSRVSHPLTGSSI